MRVGGACVCMLWVAHALLASEFVVSELAGRPCMITVLLIVLSNACVDFCWISSN